jgi:hypothetical protein
MTSDSVIAAGQYVFNPDGRSVTQTPTGGGETATGRITFSGNQVTANVGPYASYLRPGVRVTTIGTYRMEGDRLVGTARARYAGVTTSDSVVELRVSMTRVPVNN